MRGLTAGEGWQMLLAFLREQVKAREGQLFLNAGCDHIDFLRGEVGMALLVEKYPESIIQATDSLLGALDMELKHATGSTRERPSDPDADDTSGWGPEDDA
jgi:hypothetical protein